MKKKRDICISQRLYNPLPFLNNSCLYSPVDYFVLEEMLK